MKDVALAHEVGDEIVGRALVDLRRRGDLLDGALVHHRDAVGEHQRLLLVVGDEDGGEAEPALQAADLELHGLAQLAVERAERLVEQQQPRIEDDGAGERHALLLAARELARQALLVAREFDQRQRLGRPARDLRLGDVPHLQRKRHVALHREMGKQRVVLEHHADVAPGRRQGGDFHAVDLHRSRVRPLEAGHDFQERRLARAAGAEDGQEFARRHLQRHAIECRHLAEPLGRSVDPEFGRSFHARRRHAPLRPSSASRRSTAPAPWRRCRRTTHR